MKLMMCTSCMDVRSLPASRDAVACRCGKVTARYVDDLNAEWNGEGLLLGFSNSSMVHAVSDQRRHGDQQDGKGRTFTAFIIPRSASSVRITPGVARAEDESKESKG